MRTLTRLLARLWRFVLRAVRRWRVHPPFRWIGGGWALYVVPDRWGWWVTCGQPPRGPVTVERARRPERRYPREWSYSDRPN